MNTVDNLLALRILQMLTTSFEETDAFKFGLIDKKGQVLKSPSTPEEQNAYSMLDRLVFSLKRIIEKVPGGKSKLGSFIAAYWLIKESYETNNPRQLQRRYDCITSLMEQGVVLVEEELLVKRFLSEEMAANNTAGVEVKNVDAVPKKKAKKYTELIKRNTNVAD